MLKDKHKGPSNHEPSRMMNKPIFPSSRCFYQIFQDKDVKASNSPANSHCSVDELWKAGWVIDLLEWQKKTWDEKIFKVGRTCEEVTPATQMEKVRGSISYLPTRVTNNFLKLRPREKFKNYPTGAFHTCTHDPWLRHKATWHAVTRVLLLLLN